LGREIDHPSITDSARAANLSHTAEAYINLGDYFKALDHQLEARRLSEVAGDSLSLANAHRNLGTIYWHQKEFDQAEHYLRLALDFYQGPQYFVYRYTLLAALSSVYTESERYEAALRLAEESFDLAQTHEYPYGRLFSQGMIGTIYYKMEEWEKGAEKVAPVVAAFQEMGVDYETADFGLILADIYLEQHDYVEAEKQLAACRVLAQKINALPLKAKVYQSLARLYEAQNQPDLAYTYLKQHNAVQDSILSEEKRRQLASLMQKADAERQERLEAAAEERLRSARNRAYGLAGAIVLGLLGIISWQLYGRYRTQQKLRELTQARHQPARPGQGGENQAAPWAGKGAKLDPEALRTSLQGLQAQARQLSQRFGPDEAVAAMDSHLQQVEALLANLDPDNEEAAAEKWETIEVSDLLSEAVSQLPEELLQQHPRIMVREMPTLRANRAMLSHLFRHLLDNAIRYRSDRTPEVVVSVKSEPGHHRFAIKDNGQGMPAAVMHQLFEPAQSGEGEGLVIARETVAHHGGEMWVDARAGEGTTVYFTLPAMG